MIIPSLVDIMALGCILDVCMGFLGVSPAPRVHPTTFTRNLPILYYREEIQDASVVKVPSRSDLARVNISEDTELEIVSDIKRFSDLTNKWITLETTLLPKVYSDYPEASHCDGPYNISQLNMLFLRDCDSLLLRQAMSELTSIDLMRRDFGEEHYGMNNLTMTTCLFDNCHFLENSFRLQVRVFISKGELGKPGSTYVTQSEVKQVETGKVFFNATGVIML